MSAGQSPYSILFYYSVPSNYLVRTVVSSDEPPQFCRPAPPGLDPLATLQPRGPKPTPQEPPKANPPGSPLSPWLLSPFPLRPPPQQLASLLAPGVSLAGMDQAPHH